MDYVLPNINWWQYVLIIILLLSVTSLFFHLNNLPWNDFFIQSGFLVFILTVSWGFIQEQKSREELKKMLLLEIDRNLVFINENIILFNRYRNSNGKDVPKGACYLDNSIYISMLNSGKIIMLTPKAVNDLFNFNSGVKTINKRMNEYEKSELLFSDDLIFETLKRTKHRLKNLLINLDRVDIYEKSKMQGLQQALKEENILEDEIIL